MAEKKHTVEKKSNAAMWAVAKAVGIVLIIIGIIVAALSAYSWLSVGPRSTAFVHVGATFPGEGTYNQSGFNQSGFNSTSGGARFAMRRTFLANPFFEGFVIGVLLLLLGVVTYKYSGLKIALMSRK